jgi:hypothetical protein
MARRIASIYGGESVIPVFEFDESAALNNSKLSVKRFDEPNEEWALFVVNNRNRVYELPAMNMI